MKPYSQFQKIISELMIFLLLIQLSGCYSTKMMSRSRLPLANISNGILSGEIDTTGNSLDIKNRIRMYLSSDSVMKINPGYILSIPLDGIAKVKMAKYDVGLTIILVGFCAAICTLGIIAVVAITKLNSSGGF